MSQVSDYIKRAAERTKYTRKVYVEKDMPTTPSNVYALPFYGDLESTFILSSFILKSYKEKNPKDYLILCSWPGFEGMFPYVDEYWTIEDESSTKTLALGANNFYNNTTLSSDLTKNLMECMNVLTHSDWSKYWDRGFTSLYWNEFGKINRWMPEISSRISPNFVSQMDAKSGRKILVYPATKVQSWQKGRSVYLSISEKFWSCLIDRLLEEGFHPIVYQNSFTYDMSREFTDRCTYLVTRNISELLTAMNYIGLVLDVYSGISKISLAARSNFLAVTERRKHFCYGDNVLNDLSYQGGQYIFSFSTMLMTDSEKEWKVSLLDQIIARLNSLESNQMGSTKESYEEVLYDSVRKSKARRFGVKFINSSKNK